MSAQARLTISFTLLFGAIVLALAIASYLLVRNDAYLRLDAALQVATGATAMSAEHEMAEHSTKSGGERDLQLVLEEGGRSALTDTQILVRDGDRNAAFRATVHKGFDLRTIPSEKLKNQATFSGFRIAVRRVRIPEFSTTYQIYAAKPIDPALAPLVRIRTGLLVFIPVGLGFAGLAGYLLAERFLCPLKQLAQTIDAITSSDLSARVTVRNTDDEIGRLGQRFNSLLNRLEKTFSLQRRFMADASHQIRTPVTVALAAAQVTNRDPDANLCDYTDSLQVIEQQMLQLRRTVEDMFFLSQADSAPLKLDNKEIYLDDVVSDAIRAAKALAREKQQTLTINELPEAACLGDANLLKQAIMILLDNSVKFTQPGGAIDVEIRRREKNWICSVSDNGIGISEAAQAHIFERFFRENQVSHDAGAGAGLGLAIAKSIVESHQGSITLLGSRPGRTTFAIAIPALEKDTIPGQLQANSFSVRMYPSPRRE